MFSNSRDLLLTGGTYIDNHVHGAQRTGLDLLLEASSPSAFHHSGERLNPPKCHPNTRVAVLSTIMDWVVGTIGWDGLILWLYGPAGAGKSAILQTIAEQCHAKGVLLASYFFSKTDPKRNHGKSLIATLAYQITVNFPQAKDLIVAAVDNDPAIFQLSVEVQLATLITGPLIKLAQAGKYLSTADPHLIIIDGLDECQDAPVQQHIIRVIATTVSQHTSPVMFLIASRPAQQIDLEFSVSPSKEITKRVPLEHTNQADEDIKRYLKDSFRQIKTTHKLTEYIPLTWPTNETLVNLVRKSSGQFIYAATVIKYISSTQHLPTKRLQIILGLCPPQNDSDKPFAELDAIYIGILSSVHDLTKSLRMLGVLILGGLHWPSPNKLEEFMFLDPGDVRLLLVDLASVTQYEEGDDCIQILHASFPDFLLDSVRSKEYHIKPSSTHAELACFCIKHINLHHSCKICLEKDDSMGTVESHSFNTLVHHLSRAEPTGILRKEILNTQYISSLFKLPLQNRTDLEFQELVSEFLSFLKDSNFMDAEELYLHHQRIWDTMTLQKLADIPSGLGLTVCLVFTCLSQAISNRQLHFLGYLKMENTDFWLKLQSLFPGNPYYYDFRPVIGSGYCTLLEEFLTDSSRAGKYFVDEEQYCMVARLLLGSFIHPYPLQKFFYYYESSAVPDLLAAVAILLSKAGPSDDLIALVNHSNLFFHKRCCDYEDELRHIEEEISTYLLKFHRLAARHPQIIIDDS